MLPFLVGALSVSGLLNLGGGIHIGAVVAQEPPPVPIVCSVPTVKLKTKAEYQRGIPGTLPPGLEVTFYGRKPTASEAEDLLRACIQVAAHQVSIPRELLGNVWFHRAGTNEDDDEGPISLKDGSSHLVYDPQTKMIQTWKEREKARK